MSKRENRNESLFLKWMKFLDFQERNFCSMNVSDFLRVFSWKSFKDLYKSFYSRTQVWSVWFLLVKLKCLWSIVSGITLIYWTKPYPLVFGCWWFKKMENYYECASVAEMVMEHVHFLSVFHNLVRVDFCSLLLRNIIVALSFFLIRFRHNCWIVRFVEAKFNKVWEFY